MRGPRCSRSTCPWGWSCASPCGWARCAWPEVLALDVPVGLELCVPVFDELGVSVPLELKVSVALELGATELLVLDVPV